MKKSMTMLTIAATTTALVAGCAAPQTTGQSVGAGAGIGALVGAGLGQAIGRDTRSTLIGAAAGAADDSFYSSLLEYPQYTKPAVFRGMAVPEVLRNGDHAKIDAWRREASLARTLELRPDLLQHCDLSPADQKILAKLKGAKK